MERSDTAHGPRVASLCTGYGGLDEAVLEVFGGELVWVTDFNPEDKRPVDQQPAPRLLAHRYPDAPNLGDITKVDWAGLPPVEILCAGFPCTDISAAGRRAGMGAGTRSGVWSYIGGRGGAIEVLRPRLVVLENVGGLLSTRANRTTTDDETDADGELEPGPDALGDGSTGPVLRALGAVLGDLADLGFDAEWVSVPASGVGACHRRKRVFVLAWPVADPARIPRIVVNGERVSAGREDEGRRAAADTERHGCAGRSAGRPGEADESREGPRAAATGPGADVGVSGGGSGGLTLLPTPRTTDTFGPGAHGDGGLDLRTAVQLLPTPMSRDADRGAGYGDQPGWPLSETVMRLAEPGQPLPTPRAQNGEERNQTVWRRPDGEPLNLENALALLPTPRATDGTKGGPNQHGSSGDLMLPAAVQPERWGQYAAAITRHEAALGRPAPDPTEPGKTGKPRLSPRFVEWMMMLPAGWVTDVPGLTRNDMLRLLGNGVCPPQAVEALGWLLARVTTEVAA